MSTVRANPLGLRASLGQAPPFALDRRAVAAVPRVTPEERAQRLRLRLAVVSATLGFLVGALAVVVAIGWVPGL